MHAALAVMHGHKMHAALAVMHPHIACGVSRDASTKRATVYRRGSTTKTHAPLGRDKQVGADSHNRF